MIIYHLEFCYLVANLSGYYFDLGILGEFTYGLGCVIFKGIQKNTNLNFKNK